jgi:hypothetical protein
VDIPLGNPFKNPAAFVTSCVETNSVATGTACKAFGTSYSPGSYVMGRADYVAVGGLFADGQATNPPYTATYAKKYYSLWNWNVNASLGRVPDGTSNTLMYSEFCGGFQTGFTKQPQLNGWVPAGWTCNAVSVAFGTCPDPNNAQDANGDGGSCAFQASAAGLGSGTVLGGWHSGFWQVAFADGSVKPLKLGLDQNLLTSLAGFNDGDIINTNF